MTGNLIDLFFPLRRERGERREEKKIRGKG
jgi:hypothetical protein